jgi:hypothetical protein
MTIPYSLPTLKSIAQNFFEEILAKEKGKKSSLAFIKNPIPKSLLLIKEKIYQEITIGGSVFESKIIENNQEKDKKKIIIQSPFVNKKQLFVLIEKFLNPKISFLILNFAFPLEPVLRDNLLDGKLLKGTKEHQLFDLIDKIVGKEVENHIFKSQKRKIKVAVANDTIFLLLSGIKKVINPLFLVVGIIGTGTNFGFFLDEKTAVNLESGNFDKFPQTETGKIIDQKSENPDEQLFEKEVAGAYLFKHYNLLNPKKPISSTKELTFLSQKGDLLAQKLLAHSASLIACQIVGIYQYKKRFLDIKNPGFKYVSDFEFQLSDLLFKMTGSLFLYGFRYKEMVEEYTKKILNLF